MVFSNTTTQGGLVQAVEFWTRNPYGSSGNLLKEITARINRGLDNVMPDVLSGNDYIRWDDTNNTDAPIGYVNIVSGQSDYKITDDDNSLAILNISKVRILTSSSETQYTELERMTIDDEDAQEAMSPSSGVTGIPSKYLEVGNILYFDIKPNYSATNGIELFFEREPSYFVSTDTTKEPGIPAQYHELVALYAALDWNSVNRTEDVQLRNELKERIIEKRKELRNSIELRNPNRTTITIKPVTFR